jgi:hypothetical protein
LSCPDVNSTISICLFKQADVTCVCIQIVHGLHMGCSKIAAQLINLSRILREIRVVQNMGGMRS